MLANVDTETKEKVTITEPIIDPQVLAEIADEEDFVERITLKSKLAKLSQSLGSKVTNIFKRVGRK